MLPSSKHSVCESFIDIFLVGLYITIYIFAASYDKLSRKWRVWYIASYMDSVKNLLHSSDNVAYTIYNNVKLWVTGRGRNYAIIVIVVD